MSFSWISSYPKANIIQGWHILVFTETNIGQILGIFVNWVAGILIDFCKTAKIVHTHNSGDAADVKIIQWS